MTIRTLTESEQSALLRITRDHRAGLRDHVIILLALKTGLRCFEILGLNVGDVFHLDGTIKSTLVLQQYKGGKSAKRSGDRMLQSIGLMHDGLRHKLSELYAAKRKAKHDMSLTAPLFVRAHGGGRKNGSVDRNGRLSERAMRAAWVRWQKMLGWDPDTTRFFRFHDLRHTAISRYYRVAAATNGREALLAARRFARHQSVVTTEIYAHETEDEYLRALKRM